MTRRFLLVGLFVIIKPGSILQIALAAFISVFYLVFQMQAQPYLNITDDYLANVCSTSIVLIFVACLFIKIAALTELPVVNSVLSLDLKYVFDVPAAALVITLYISILSSVGLSMWLALHQIRAKRKRREREEKASKARRLRYVVDGKIVIPPRLPPNAYHLFLSHVWATGQDQMRVMKQRLKEMCPDFSVFLDVDDLEDIGDLEGYISRTSTVLIFCSQGYFQSKNCMREIRAAVRMNKPLLAVLEPEVGKGGLSVEEVRHQLRLADASYGKWGFGGDGGPSSEQLVEALFKLEPIEWNRIGHFQDVTLRLIAERLLPDLDRMAPLAGMLLHNKWGSGKGGSRAAKGVTKLGGTIKAKSHVSRNKGTFAVKAAASSQPAEAAEVEEGEAEAEEAMSFTFIQNELAQQATPDVPPPRDGRRYHLYCSPHNAGGVAYAREVSRRLGLGLRLAEDFAEMALAECFLVYLTDQTWTSGDATEAFTAEVLQAVRRGLRLHLAHEMPGQGGQEARHGVEFSTFFSCDRGATPLHLIKTGLYDQIAVALKGGEWRKASMMLAAQELAKSPAALLPEKGSEGEVEAKEKQKRASQTLEDHAGASSARERRASLGMGSDAGAAAGGPSQGRGRLQHHGSTKGPGARSRWQMAYAESRSTHSATSGLPLARSSDDTGQDRWGAVLRQATAKRLPAPHMMPQPPSLGNQGMAEGSEVYNRPADAPSGSGQKVAPWAGTQRGPPKGGPAHQPHQVGFSAAALRRSSLQKGAAERPAVVPSLGRATDILRGSGNVLAESHRGDDLKRAVSGLGISFEADGTSPGTHVSI